MLWLVSQLLLSPALLHYSYPRFRLCHKSGLAGKGRIHTPGRSSAVQYALRRLQPERTPVCLSVMPSLLLNASKFNVCMLSEPFFRVSSNEVMGDVLLWLCSLSRPVCCPVSPPSVIASISQSVSQSVGKANRQPCSPSSRGGVRGRRQHGEQVWNSEGKSVRMKKRIVDVKQR